MYIPNVDDLASMGSGVEFPFEFVTVGYCDQRSEEYKHLILKLMPNAVFREITDDVHGKRIMVFAPKGSDRHGLPPVTCY